MTDLIISLLTDPEILDLLVEIFEAALIAAGLPVAWIAASRKYVKRFVRLIVLKIAVECKAESGDIELDAIDVRRETRKQAAEVLPKAVVKLPTVGNLIDREATAALRDIAGGISPVPKTARGMLAVDFADKMKKVGASASYSAGHNVNIGADVTYDWQNDTIDWGGKVEVKF